MTEKTRAYLKGQSDCFAYLMLLQIPVLPYIPNSKEFEDYMAGWNAQEATIRLENELSEIEERGAR